MADEKNKNLDPEEEQDNQFDDDEDFGLPELEYDELDDDEDSDLDEEPDFEVPEDEPVAESDEATEAGDLDDEAAISIEDLDDSETEDWEKELEQELENEMQAEESGGFYEEESYDEFESSAEVPPVATNDDVPPVAAQNEDPVTSSSDEDYIEDSGDEYSENTSVAANTYNSGYNSESASTGKAAYVAQYDNAGSNNKFARTVVIGTLAFAVIATVLLWFWKNNKEDSQPVAVEQAPPKQPVQQQPAEPEPVVEEPVREEPEQPQPNQVVPGEITLLEQSTGKSYVVIGSFFDGDMANDYARELAAEGKSPMVIPPFKNYRYYRVAIAEFDRFQDAQASIDNYQNEYGQEVWPLRY